MKTSINLVAVAAAGLSSFALLAEAKHGNVHLSSFERRHVHHHAMRMSRSENPLEEALSPVEKRSGKCQFPSDAGLVAVTPDKQNAGWAMSPDQPCKPGNYCPYACPPGELMAQWDPKAIKYEYPMSMNGGLYCDNSGQISKPFPDKPYCVKGTGTVGCKNNAAGNVAFCQTVLPGNEAMLIATNVEDVADLAVPGTSYWAETSAHYYINPPGVSVEEGCIWGTSKNPRGNWTPYVAGANTDKDGSTFLKLGWNPIYLEEATPFRNEMPDWGVKIECEGDKCNGLPCSIDPESHKVNECASKSKGGAGAGGGNFCVVTVPKGEKANIVVFSKGGKSKPENKPEPKPEEPKHEEPTPEPTSTYVAPSSSAPPPPPPPPPSTSSSSIPSNATVWHAPTHAKVVYTSSSSSAPPSIYTPSAAPETTEENKVVVTDTPSSSSVTVSPHVFVEVSTGSANYTAPLSTEASQATPVSPAEFTGAATAPIASILGASLSSFLAAVVFGL
ncbi:MAG: hypothetical protein M1833_002683 [Piccolia ochrophora]|nr:MAG: hypothetical protein M1833_002683 [Piccolia ochrophora]